MRYGLASVEAAIMGLRALVLIRDADLEELILDLLRLEDEVFTAWPRSEELRRDGIQLLVADVDDLPEGSRPRELVRRWSRWLPTILLSSRLAIARREGCCLALPKPIPLPLFVAFIDGLRPHGLATYNA